MPSDAPQTLVLRYRDGHAVRCTLQGEFTPKDDDVIEVSTVEGDDIEVPLSELKAVFFLKDPRRRGVEMELGQPSQPPPGTAPARVEFFDGEIVHGRVQNYSVANRGFFLYPTSMESNNERIFVMAAALSTLAIEG